MKNGFSLIEVLVSIVILALGVIGTAGMQVAMLRSAQQSAFHAFAMQIASEMADTMLADHGHARQAAGVDPYLGIDYRSATDHEPEGPGKSCYGNACNALELAEFEIYDWKKRIKAALPSGRVMVCRDSNPWNAGQKALSWSCDDEANSAAPVVIKLGWRTKNPDGSLRQDATGAVPPIVALTVAI